MDSSTPQGQSTPNAQASVIGRGQAPAPTISAGTMSPNEPVVQSVPTPQTISVHPEQGPVQTGSSSVEDSEDEVQPARQEVSTKPVQNTAEIQQVEIQPTTPELQVEKSVENIVEKTPELDQPKISEVVKAAGVTHSGPGVPIDENAFNVKVLPMTYEQALNEEKTHPKLNDSKHWLAELVLYVWRKLDPTHGRKKGEKQENKFLKILN